MFQIIWLQRAVNDLAEIWTRADSVRRQAVTEAANAIDQTLRSNPTGWGESRGGEKRIGFAPPSASTSRSIG